MWFVEDYRLFTYWRAFAPLYDLFAVIQKEPFFSELAAAGVANALYLPMAASPEAHRPMTLSPAEKQRFGAELSFMGAGYPNRRAAFRQLTRYGLKIWGTEWEGDAVLAPFVQLQGRRIGTEDTARIFNATAINLNLHSSVRADELVPEGDFVNPRTFEIAACGAFQLVDKRSLMPELFSDDELATFNSMETLEAGIAYFRSRPEERAAYADRARKRVLAEHTYAARMRALLAFAAERLPQRVRNAGRDWPADLPEPLRAELKELYAALGLPSGASFDDVVAAVRRKSDELSSLETAVLFLDEWKKQYSL
jgi:spore maturation protein CgeB